MFETTTAYRLIQADSAQRNFVARRLAALGLHVGQELFLMRLWQQDGQTQSELMTRMGCSAPTITKAVQLSGTGLGAGGRTALILMHLATGAILIPGLYLTARRES